MDGYLTTDDIARRLGIKVETVRRWVHQGKLPGFPLGRAGYRIRQEDFERFMQGPGQQFQQSAHFHSEPSTFSSPTESREEPRMEAIATLILERMTDGVVLFGPDGHCQYVNTSAAQLLGVAPEHLLGKTVDQLLPKNFVRLQENMEEGNGDFFSAATGRWFQVRMFAALHGRCLSFLDVTERKQLEAQQRFFEAILANVKGFVFVWNRQKQFVYANQALERLWGVGHGDAVGKTTDDLGYPPELSELLARHIEQVFETGADIIDEVPYTNPAGVSGYYEYILSPVVASDGTIEFVAGIAQDTTERKQMEQQKNDFLGMVSHELKTPVTSAKAFAEVLENRFRKAGDEKNAVLLGKMHAQMDKLTLLIGDLLEITRIEAGKLQFHEDFFAFDDLVEDIIEEVQRTTTHTIQREGTTSAMVYGDRDRIGQVLINLLTNAIKYSPNATRVVVTSLCTQHEITLCVQDFGIGIARDKLPHVFERFFREDGPREETFPGIGLGLYISAEILQRQGGKIWAESEKGHGSTFCFSLPLQDSKGARRHDDLFIEEGVTRE